MNAKKGLAVGLGLASITTFVFYFMKGAQAAPPNEEPEPGMANLYGRVTNSSTGNGIAGVQVLTVGHLTETNSSGYYTFENLTPGTYTLGFSKDGYESGEADVSLDEGNNELNAQMIPEGGEGEIALIRVWYEPLKSWGIVWTSPDFSQQLISGEIPLNGEIYLNPLWTTRSEAYIVGHIDLVVTYPDGTSRTLLATGHQDFEGNGANVLFEPFTSSQEGNYTVEVTLSSSGQVLDTVTFSLTAVRKIEITGITLNPTALIEQEAFTFTLTFSNPHDYDVWVHPEFTLGKLIGEVFTPEAVLASLGWSGSALEISMNGKMETLDLGIDFCKGSGMTFYIYTPDGRALTSGSPAYLKVPANGQATTSKRWYISSKARSDCYVTFTYGYPTGYVCNVFPPIDLDARVTVVSAFNLIYHPEGTGIIHYGLPEAIGNMDHYEKVNYTGAPLPIVNVVLNVVNVRSTKTPTG